MDNELERATMLDPLSIPNYTLLIAAVQLAHNVSHTDLSKAREYLNILIDRKVRSPLPYAWMAKTLVMSQVQGQNTDAAELGQKASDFTRAALDINPNCSLALTMDGLVNTNIIRDLDTAQQRYDAALSVNPNESLALLLRGTLRAFKGEGKDAVKDTRRALELSPRDPLKYYYLSLGATAALADQNYEEALSLSHRSLELNAHHASTLRAKAISEVNLGMREHARQSMKQLLNIDKQFSVSRFLSQSPSADFDVGRHWAASLLKAGAPG